MWSRIKAVLIGLTVLALGASQPACACDHGHHVVSVAEHEQANSSAVHDTGHGAGGHHAAAGSTHHMVDSSDQAELSCNTDAPLCNHSSQGNATVQANAGDAVKSVGLSSAPSPAYVMASYPHSSFQQARTEQRTPRLRPPPTPSPVTLKIRLLN